MNQGSVRLAISCEASAKRLEHQPSLGRFDRMNIYSEPYLQQGAADGPRKPNNPPLRDRPEPPIHDPPPNPPEPDQPFGDPTPLPGNDPPDPPMKVDGPSAAISASASASHLAGADVF